MAAQTFSMIFKGYWREPNKGSIPAESGVYCVYTCVLNVEQKSVTLQKLLYIGEAGNVRDRVANHERLEDWEAHLRDGEQLCYSFSPSSFANRERCEAALIFQHKPPENDEYKHDFPFDPTTIITTGKNKFLHPKFQVQRPRRAV
jgi:excinuclease UvrABC nuclease subunit